MNRKKWQRYIRSKGLEPQMNRKKFGSILFGTTIVVFFLFILRFSYIVAVGKVGANGTSLSTKTQELYQGEQLVKAKRGSIYDRNGILIAGDATSYSAYVMLDKNYLGVYDSKTKEKEKLYVEDQNKEQVAQVLKKYLNVKPSFALKQMNQKKNIDGLPVKQVEFGKEGKEISLETKNKIEEELAKDEIKGVYFTEHPARIYPNGVFSPYLIGYTVPIDDGDQSKGLVGFNGVEASYDKELSGTDGLIRFQKDNMQKPLPGSIVTEKEAVDGTDIYLTLDAQLQSRLEDLVEESFEEYKPEDITATLVEAKTGNILALTQRPAFNPETLEGLDDDGQWQNLSVEQPFEPGSTMKVFTVAAAIETGNFNPNATFETGRIEVDDRTIADHIPDGVGTITYRQALTWSSNVGMVNLQRAMDMKWLDYLKRFGFGQSTNSGLPGEAVGNILTETTVDRAMTAYGQAIAVTPFQMVQGFTAFTNNGEMLKPNYISKYVEADGTEKKVKPEVVGTPISASTANQVLDMMTDVVEDEQLGTGTAYALDDYRVAAKTGTAEISEDGDYLKNQYLYSAVQMVPAEDPEYIMYVTIRKPPVGVTATGLIADISNTLLERALNVDTAVPEEDNDK